MEATKEELEATKKALEEEKRLKQARSCVRTELLWNLLPIVIPMTVHQCRLKALRTSSNPPDVLL